jgi:hypothetical protein
MQLHHFVPFWSKVRTWWLGCESSLAPSADHYLWWQTTYALFDAAVKTSGVIYRN